MPADILCHTCDGALDHSFQRWGYDEHSRHKGFHGDQGRMTGNLSCCRGSQEGGRLNCHPEREEVFEALGDTMLVPVPHAKEKRVPLQVLTKRVRNPRFAEHQLHDAVENVHIDKQWQSVGITGVPSDGVHAVKQLQQAPRCAYTLRTHGVRTPGRYGHLVAGNVTGDTGRCPRVALPQQYRNRRLQPGTSLL